MLAEGLSKCLIAATLQGLTLSPRLSCNSQLEPTIQAYNTSNFHYFMHNNFITSNNLHYTLVLQTFLQAARSIQQCIDTEQLFELRGHEIETVIIIQCVSGNSPKYVYYITDHTDRIIRWIHGTPRFYHTNDGKLIRLLDTSQLLTTRCLVCMWDIAEYWHHRSKFTAHKFCTQGNRNDVINLLQGISNQNPQSEGFLIVSNN
jgi:hypothetical protein